MKPKQYLTAALIAALAVPALAARDIQSAEPPVEANDAAQLGEASDQGQIVVRGQGQIVTQDGVVVRLAGEKIELDGQGGVFELQLPNVIREMSPAPKPIEATFLGVATEPMTPQAAKEAGLEKAIGLQVFFIAEDSPAAKAGLQKGDVLLKLNDQILINVEQLVVLIRTFEPGEKVTLHVNREGKPLAVEATLSSAMVAPVGPGGAALDQPGWRVQQNGAFGPNGGAMILPGNFFDQFVPLEGAPVDLEEFIRKMQQNQDQNMGQLLQRLELNLEEIQGGANGGVAMQSQVMKNDGQHSITLKTGNDGQHLTIKDKAGEVLYEGILPKEDVEQHLLEDNGLPMDIFKKVQPMLKGNMLKLDFNLDGLEKPGQAPEEQAKPGRA